MCDCVYLLWNSRARFMHNICGFHVKVNRDICSCFGLHKYHSSAESAHECSSRITWHHIGITCSQILAVWLFVCQLCSFFVLMLLCFYVLVLMQYVKIFSAVQHENYLFSDWILYQTLVGMFVGISQSQSPYILWVYDPFFVKILTDWYCPLTTFSF